MALYSTSTFFIEDEKPSASRPRNTPKPHKAEIRLSSTKQKHAHKDHKFLFWLDLHSHRRRANRNHHGHRLPPGQQRWQC